MKRARALADEERGEEALGVLDDVVARFRWELDVPLRECVAAALLAKSAILGRLNRLPEEIAIYDEIVAAFGPTTEASLTQCVATALGRKRLALDRLRGQPGGGATGGRLVMAPPAKDWEHVEAATALVINATNLGNEGRNEEAIAIYEEVIARFGATNRPDLLERVIIAKLDMAISFRELKRHADAITVYDDLIARFKSAPELGLRAVAATALVHKGIELSDLEREQEAIDAFDDAIVRFGTESEPAFARKSRRRSSRRQSHSAASVAERKSWRSTTALIRHFGSDDWPPVLEAVAAAFVGKGEALANLSRRKEALAAFDEVIARFSAAPEPPLQEAVSDARLQRDRRKRAWDKAQRLN